MQLTKLEVKRRNLDAENLQVGVTSPSPAPFASFFLFSVNFAISLVPSMSLHHGKHLTLAVGRSKFKLTHQTITHLTHFYFSLTLDTKRLFIGIIRR